MNYASELFSAAVKPFTRRSTSTDNSSSRRVDPGRRPQHQQQQQNPDLEEDGFLVVGQTRSDRSTINTKEFCSEVDAPPSYDILQDGKEQPPTYMNFIQSTSPSQVWNASSYLNQTNQQMSGQMLPGSYGTLVTANSAVTGVPFAFSNQVQTVIDATKGINNIPQMGTHTFDDSRYSYDYSLENQVLNKC